MNKKLRFVTETAVMLALLVSLQALTKPMGQLVTGTCVNAVLAITVFTVGLPGAITVACISPVMAFLLTIAPNAITVLPIMLGNVCYVLLLHLLAGKGKQPLWKQGLGIAVAAATKFVVLYLLVVKVVCGLAAGSLLGKKVGQTVLLAPPMLKMLPTMFTWPQLITALLGGAVALAIRPALNKALKRNA